MTDTRSDDTRTLTSRVDGVLADKVAEVAARNDRTVSSFIKYTLRQAVTREQKA